MMHIVVQIDEIIDGEKTVKGTLQVKRTLPNSHSFIKAAGLWQRAALISVSGD